VTNYVCLCVFVCMRTRPCVCDLVSHKSLWSIIFMIFPPTVYIIRTGTLSMARKGESVDRVVTCYRLDSRIWTPVWGKRFSVSLTCLDQPWGPPSLVYRANCSLSWEYISRGMEVITHPHLVLILRNSRAIRLLLLCASVGVLWSDVYFLCMCAGLYMNSVVIYQQISKATNNKSVTS
jgi:hypothetical protein